jgi:hypothetical protein
LSARPLSPTDLLATLSECGVDFVVIGALAVGVHGEVRGTGDVDVMVPSGDDANKRALETALGKLGAERILPEHGEDPDYPVLMFGTRYGRLDILYRPDGSAPYAKVKARAITRRIGGQPVRVAGKDDMVRMKLAAGRPDDLRDVASMTASERGETRRIRVTMQLTTGVDEAWAIELTRARVTLFDPQSRVWMEGGRLEIDAGRADLTDQQLRMWARALAERLYGSAILAGRTVEIDIA